VDVLVKVCLCFDAIVLIFEMKLTSNLGQTYETDNGLVFVKNNQKESSLLMFLGEFESLKTIQKTQTVRVPKPLCVVADPEGSGAVIVLEYLQMNRLKEHSGRLGELLANLHLFNEVLGKKKLKSESWVGKANETKDENETQELEYVEEFGFHITTCCGFLPQNNEWLADWPTFYTRNRLKQQIDLIETSFGDREVMDLWSHLQLKIDKYFIDIKDNIKPALLHGDLWSGNVAQLPEEPVVFDAASFYGHSEYDLSIAQMFGGFNRAFYECYHNKIPKASGFDRFVKLSSLISSNFLIKSSSGELICMNYFTV
jgi:fructosamine-3-kinase